MPRQRASINSFEARDYIRCILKFMISPIYFCMELLASYTGIFMFNSNIAFWHLLPICSISFSYLFYNSMEEMRENQIFSYYLLSFSVFLFLLLLISPVLPQKIQRLTQVRIGLSGMVLSVNSQIFCIFAERRKEFDLNTIRIIDAVSIWILIFSYIIFFNLCTRVYIRLPVKMMPFSFGVKQYVKVIAVLHLIYAIAFIIGLESNNPNYHLKILISSFLIFCSFFISVDAYSMIFIDQYLLCEHRETKEDFETKKPIGGTICHVAIRRAFNKRKDLGDLPADFQYDDDIKLHPKWYTEYVPFCMA